MTVDPVPSLSSTVKGPAISLGLERLRNVLVAMQDPPNLDPAGLFDIEHQVRKAVAHPESQAGQVELVGIARRSGSCVFLDVPIGFFDRVDKGEGHFRKVGHEIVDDLLDNMYLFILPVTILTFLVSLL